MRSSYATACKFCKNNKTFENLEIPKTFKNIWELYIWKFDIWKFYKGDNTFENYTFENM